MSSGPITDRGKLIQTAGLLFDQQEMQGVSFAPL
jgi:hypothetical protein